MFFFLRALFSREKLKKELKKELKGCSNFGCSIVYPCNMRVTYWQHTRKLHATRCYIVYTCSMRATCMHGRGSSLPLQLLTVHPCNMRVTYWQHTRKLRALSWYSFMELSTGVKVESLWCMQVCLRAWNPMGVLAIQLTYKLYASSDIPTCESWK